MASQLAFASKAAAGVGGIVGGVGGMYAAYATWREAYSLKEEGDETAGGWRLYSAYAFGAFAGFSVFPALQKYSSQCSFKNMGLGGTRLCCARRRDGTVIQIRRIQAQSSSALARRESIWHG